MNIIRNEKASLFRKIVIPVISMIIMLVSIFCIAASAVVLNLQNKNMQSMIEESIVGAYRNVSIQLNGIDTFMASFAINPEIDDIMNTNSSARSDIIVDYYKLYTVLQNMSLLSLKTENDKNEEINYSYNLSIIPNSDNAFNQIANSTFASLYSIDSVKNKEWYKKMISQNLNNIWWTEEISDKKYIFKASKKYSLTDGRENAILTLAYDIDNLRNILDNPIVNGVGYYNLIDENYRVISSSKYGFQTKLIGDDFISNLKGSQGDFLFNVNGVKSIVYYNTFKNGWKIIAIVPEKNVNSYTILIFGISILSGLVFILLAGAVIWVVANNVRRPISRLVTVMEKIEVEDFSDKLPTENKIYEVDELYKGYNFMTDKLNSLINDVYLKDIEKKQLQLNLLQSQINPHFLYNTLDIINSMAKLRHADDISFVVKSLANVFRYGLNRGRDVISLKNELNQIRSYLEIQKLMNKKLDYVIEADDDIFDVLVINLIIQPFIENAIIHGFRNTVEDCKIEISAYESGTELFIDIKDNGVGIKVDKYNSLLEDTNNEQLSSYGILNVHKRIKLHYGDKYGIHYINVDQGTCVRITLPVVRE